MDQKNFVPVQIQWKNIKYSVVKAGGLPCRKKREVTTIKILQDVSGVVEPGNTLAIVGPSGSGKTTLLNVLSGRLAANKWEGTVLINGEKADRNILKKVAGYVPQEDILMGSQTVREALNFYAELKLPRKMKTKEKHEIVESIIAELGLKKVSNSLIGYVGEDAANSGLRRGLSGGERKRLSIGLQLVSNPSLLFLDEPTTGLDSFAALSVVTTLTKLAKQGRTVIFTIHQPSSEIMAMFDNLMVISHGKTLYFGPSAQVVDYFASIGYKCPEYENPGDYIMETVIIGKDETEREGFTGSKSKELPAPDASKLKKKGTVDFSRSIATAEILAEAFSKSDYFKYTQKQADIPAKVETGGKRTTAGLFTQMRFLMERSFKNVLREPNVLRAGLIQIVIIAVLMGLIFLRRGFTQSSIQDRLGALFMGSTFTMFSGLLGPFYLFPTERKIFLFQNMDGLYSTFAYYVAKLVAEIPVFLIEITLFSTIFYWMVNLHPGAAQFFLFITYCFLIANVAFSFGVFVIGLFPNPAVALNIFPLLFVPQMIFSGFYINPSSVPPWFVWLEYITFLKYAFEPIAQNEFQGETFYCTDSELANSGGVCPFTTGEQVLNFYSLNTLPVWADVLILIGFMLVFHTGAFILLKIAARRLK
jgi:ABC-type multidrug transport system ATPase subunit/ABC-type multidrug transport system permease subunit